MMSSALMELYVLAKVRHLLLATFAVIVFYFLALPLIFIPSGADVKRKSRNLKLTMVAKNTKNFGRLSCILITDDVEQR